MRRLPLGERAHLPRVERLLAELSARQQDLPQAIEAGPGTSEAICATNRLTAWRIRTASAPRRAKPGQRGDTVNLTPDQLHRLGQLSDQWSFLWDKRWSLWIAAEDCPDGEQVEDADPDVLLARLPEIAAPRS